MNKGTESLFGGWVVCEWERILVNYFRGGMLSRME